MVTKSISLATATATAVVFLQSQLSSNDPLFLFISSSLVVNCLMLVLAGTSVYLSFAKKFDNWYAYAACAGLSVLFIASGFLGVFYSDYIHSLWSGLMPLNYIVMMLCGIVAAICAISYQHPAMPAGVRTRLQQLSALSLPNIVLPVPKIPHPPTAISRRLSGTTH